VTRAEGCAADVAAAPPTSAKVGGVVAGAAAALPATAGGALTSGTDLVLYPSSADLAQIQLLTEAVPRSL
jgi:hypothetical protein